MSADWLAGLIEQAVKRGRCFAINCTTCGGFPFRKDVLDYAKNISNEPNNFEKTLALAMTTIPVRDEFEEALRLLIYDQISTCRRRLPQEGIVVVIPRKLRQTNFRRHARALFCGEGQHQTKAAFY